MDKNNVIIILLIIIIICLVIGLAIVLQGTKNVTPVVNNTTNNTTTVNTTVENVSSDDKASNDNNEPSYASKIKTHYDPNSGGSIIDLSELSEDEYAQYLGYSDADEMNRETERKRAESYSKY